MLSLCGAWHFYIYVYRIKAVFCFFLSSSPSVTFMWKNIAHVGGTLSPSSMEDPQAHPSLASTVERTLLERSDQDPTSWPWSSWQTALFRAEVSWPPGRPTPQVKQDLIENSLEHFTDWSVSAGCYLEAPCELCCFL